MIMVVFNFVRIIKPKNPLTTLAFDCTGFGKSVMVNLSKFVVIVTSGEREREREEREKERGCEEQER